MRRSCAYESTFTAPLGVPSRFAKKDRAGRRLVQQCLLVVKTLFVTNDHNYLASPYQRRGA